MTRQEKLIERLKGRPRDFRWEELESGFFDLLATRRPQEAEPEDRDGVSFIRPRRALSFHKPHPGNIVRAYVVDELLRVLIEERLI